jgi:hypothetical protein
VQWAFDGINRQSIDSPRSRSDLDSPSGRDASVAASCSNPTYLNVFTVEEYERDGKAQKRWTKFGAAFPHKEGGGFSVELHTFPIDGRLVVLPPDPADESRNNK